MATTCWKRTFQKNVTLAETWSESREHLLLTLCQSHCLQTGLSKSSTIIMSCGTDECKTFASNGDTRAKGRRANLERTEMNWSCVERVWCVRE
ncbi:unnamed protein product [Allacma fusca]|uniref:Uncharacterized protein n=1 Tax=Allacma fusca TaxID=39272 RepID=A0A8J2M7K9_9HEXA|nr:unnamed protein product [Allacma fusca]